MNHHARTLAHEGACDAEADSLRRAGDERVLTGESHGARLYAALTTDRRDIPHHRGVSRRV
jgi:hypothetical protein